MKAWLAQDQVLTSLIRCGMDITCSQISNKTNLSCLSVDRLPGFNMAVSTKRRLENQQMNEVLLHPRENSLKISRWPKTLKWSNKRYSNEKIWTDTSSITGTICRTQLIPQSPKGLNHLTQEIICEENQSQWRTVRSPIKTICLTVSRDLLNALELHIQTPHRDST